MMSEDIHNVTSLLESGAGPSPCNMQDGPQPDLFGQEVAHANPSALLEKAKEKTTPGTCGLNLNASLRSARLQLSLESRLRARMDVNGSLEYVLIWKHWDMPWGGAICALRASGRRTSDSDFFGWPTPRAQNATGSWEGRNPSASDGEGGPLDILKAKAEKLSPKLKLRDQCLMAGWATPTVQDAENCAGPSQWQRNSWPLNVQATSGQTTLSSHVETGKQGVLNPDLPLWLQGYPETWALYARPATQLVHK